MKRFALFTALRVLAVLVLAVAANADTLIYDSTAQSSDGADPIYSFGPLYDSFSTGVNSGAISSLAFILASGGGGGDISGGFYPAQGAEISVGLYADDGTAPGSLIAFLGTIPDSSLTVDLSLVNLTPVSFPVLDAGTRYWIGLTDNGNAVWAWTADTSGIGVEGEYFANSSGVFPNDPNGGYQMAVELGATGIPEPSTVGLCAIALLGLAASRLRRCRAS